MRRRTSPTAQIMVKRNWMKIFIWICAAIFILDRITKYFVVRTKPVFDFLPSIGFHYTLNPGVSFGMLTNWPWIPFIISIGVLIAIVYYYKEIPKNGSMQIGIALIFGGTLGNLIDRFLYGSVVDFISIAIWPAFNLADSAIVIGAGLIIIYSIKKEK